MYWRAQCADVGVCCTLPLGRINKGPFDRPDTHLTPKHYPLPQPLFALLPPLPTPPTPPVPPPTLNMRFSTVVFVAALAGMAAAAPVARRSLVTESGGAVKSLEDAVGVTAVEDTLDRAVGGAITKAEKKLGVTYAEEELGLAKRRFKGDIQTIGNGVNKIEVGTGVSRKRWCMSGYLAVCSLSQTPLDHRRREMDQYDVRRIGQCSRAVRRCDRRREGAWIGRQVSALPRLLPLSLFSPLATCPIPLKLLFTALTHSFLFSVCYARQCHRLWHTHPSLLTPHSFAHGPLRAL